MRTRRTPQRPRARGGGDEGGEEGGEGEEQEVKEGDEEEHEEEEHGASSFIADMVLSSIDELLANSFLYARRHPPNNA